MRRSASSRAAPPGLKRIAWRILGAIFVLWAAATFVFFVQQLLPGSQATLILNQQTGNQQSYTAAAAGADRSQSTASTSRS